MIAEISWRTLTGVRFKEAIAGLFVAICGGIALTICPSGNLVLQVFVWMSVLFSLLFALHGVFVDKGSSRDKFWMVLPSPVAGIVISMVLFAIFFGVAFLLAFGQITIPIGLVTITVFVIVVARRYLRGMREWELTHATKVKAMRGKGNGSSGPSIIAALPARSDRAEATTM